MNREIPLVKQEHYHTCAEANLLMAALAMGIEPNREKLLKALAPTPEEGTPNKHFASVARELFILNSLNRSSIFALNEGLHKGRIIIANFLVPADGRPMRSGKTYVPHDSSKPFEGHYALVVERLDDHLLMNDPACGKNIRMSISDFLTRWRAGHGNEVRWILEVLEAK